MAQPIVTRPGSFSVPLASPSSPSSSSSSSTALNSPVPRSPAQLKRSSFASVDHHDTTRSPGPASEARDDKQNELVEALKRSVTIVFWHKANAQPLRIREEISTFPFFRLTDLSDLVSTLGLSHKTYVDFYNPQARLWEQEPLFAVHEVDSGQRVLYRMRRNLIHGLEDAECPGIEAELRLQEELEVSTWAPRQSLLKLNKRRLDHTSLPPRKHHRPSSSRSSTFAYTLADAHSNTRATSPLCSDDDAQGSDAGETSAPTVVIPSSGLSPTTSPASSIHSLPRTVSRPIQGYQYVPNTPISPVQQALPTARSTSIVSNANVPISSESSLALAVTDPQSNPSPTSSQRSLPTQSPQSSRPALPPQSQPRSSETPAPTAAYASAPASKAWPHGKFVCEVAAGFREMDDLMKNPSIKQADAFLRVFGVTYKKSTVCNHRKWWREAPAHLLEEWTKMGRDERASWNEFVRILEGREPKRNVGLGLGGAKGVSGFAMTAQAFGSPQGGVLSLSTSVPMTLPVSNSMQGIGIGVPAVAQQEEPMGSLRPPDEQQQRFLG